MNILILGDVAGPSRDAVVKKLPDLIKKKKIDFVIVNGENAGDTGYGITEKNADEFFNAGADVTSEYIWVKKKLKFIDKEKDY